MSDPIKTWWNQFEIQAPHFDAWFNKREQWDLPTWMNENLGAIDPNLMWEFGPALNGTGHRLVITPESHRELRPLVREIISRAPTLPDWEFYEYRLAESFEIACLTVEARTGGDLRLLKVSAVVDKFHCINLVFLFDETDFDQRQAMNVGFIATECLLGEEVLDRWTGTVDAISSTDSNTTWVEMSELPRLVAALIELIQHSLPDRPWCVTDRDNNWSVIEISPEEMEDYPQQLDMFVAVSVVPKMVHNALSGRVFDSVRHSRCGEVFAYLKIDGSDGLEHSDFADRGEIEAAIDAVLIPNSLGCTVGGGTGWRYSYIELAILDVDQAWSAISTVLSNGRIPKRTWLLFHDDNLSSQSYGLYEDTPLPPEHRRDEED